MTFDEVQPLTEEQICARLREKARHMDGHTSECMCASFSEDTKLLATIQALRVELAQEKARRREFPEDYRLPEKWVQRAIRELHMTRDEIEAKVASCVRHHRAKGTPFKRHDLAAWNWLSERFVPNGKPTPEPKQKPYVHKVTEE